MKRIPKHTRKDVERKKKLAYTLFVENGFEQIVIAEITGISEQTIVRWKKDGNWQDDKREARMGFEQRRKRLQRMMDNLLTRIESRKSPEDVPDSKEGDILNKLADSAKKLQTELSYAHKAETGKQFIQYIQKLYGQEKAIDIVELWHEFIMSTT